MSIPADSLRAAVLKALADEVTSAVKDGKASLQQVMEDLKIKSLTAELPDGTEVATVARAGGKTSARVTDPAKFLAWVQGSHPAEVEPVVRSSYQTALLAAIDSAGDAIDPDSGEVVPGVEFTTGTAYLTVTYAKGDVGGQELIKRAWRGGQISLDSLLALPGGEPDE